MREHRAPARSSSLRIAFAGALSATMLVVLSAMGGLGYAARGAHDAVNGVHKLVAPKAQKKKVVVGAVNAGSDQYRPGYGFGDKNHIHTGPPGLTKKGGPLAPPLKAKKSKDGNAATSARV